MNVKRHCAIVTVYKDIEGINRMLSHLPPSWSIYLHIDKKSQISPKDILRKCNISKKYKIYWGGINHLKAILDMLKEASAFKFDYYHVITGQDYPIFTEKSLEIILGTENNIFMRWFQLPQKGWMGDGTRILKYRTLSNLVDVRNFPFRILNVGLRFFQSIFHLRQKLPEYPLFGGLVYCSLPHYAVDYIIYSKMSNDLLKRLKWSSIGEELFFQTVLMNSPYRERVVNNNLRFMIWTDKGTPKTLEYSDLSKIESSKALFIRKIDKSSSNLLDHIDKRFSANS